MIVVEASKYGMLYFFNPFGRKSDQIDIEFAPRSHCTKIWPWDIVQRSGNGIRQLRLETSQDGIGIGGVERTGIDGVLIE